MNARVDFVERRRPSWQRQNRCFHFITILGSYLFGDNISVLLTSAPMYKFFHVRSTCMESQGSMYTFFHFCHIFSAFFVFQLSHDTLLTLRTNFIDNMCIFFVSCATMSWYLIPWEGKKTAITWPRWIYTLRSITIFFFLLSHKQNQIGGLGVVLVLYLR